MLTKTKIAIAAALFAATSTAAFAQGFDPNLANRYPGYADLTAAAASAHVSTHTRTLQSAPVRLQQRNVALPNDDSGIVSGQSEFDIDRSDRASSPYAGGGF
jgi:hypothetical protein